MKRIILASVSPRRAELLGMLVDKFDVVDSGATEESECSDPNLLVCELARRKAETVFLANSDAVVIGADTVVTVDEKILGKPADEADAREMIALLQGKAHFVHTGLCVMDASACKTVVCRTEVVFDKMSANEIDEYIAQGDWTDEAGAYGIQGAAAKHIAGICGCYYNVMGLPVNALYKILQELLQP